MSSSPPSQSSSTELSHQSPDGTPPGWDFLRTQEALELLTDLDERTGAGADTSALVPVLRKRGLGPDETSAVLTQLRLRRQAQNKLGDLAPQNALFTQAGLEQATRAVVARAHAQRFSRAGLTSVADLGCGLGAESLAFAEAGLRVLAVERDQLTAQLASHNLAGFPQARVVTGDAESTDLTGIDAVFLDPARRTAGHHDTRRIASPEDFSPSLTFAFGHGDRLPTGVKLGPGLDRELLPTAGEAQWVSVGGQVVELGVWFGSLATPNVGRSALRFDSEGSHELTAEADSDDAAVVGLGSVLYEPDGAVIRARLIGKLADQLGAGMLSEQIAYLSAPAYVPTPFATGYRVLDEVPVKERDLRRELAARNIGTLEIKKRGIDVNPAELRKRLKLKGSVSATLFLTRVAGKHTAFLAERLPVAERPRVPDYTGA